MKIRYLNGVKVCAVESEFNKFVAIYNYRDVVCSISRIFKEAELSESKINGIGDPMEVVLMMINGMYNLQEKRISTRENKVFFDDEINIKKTKQPQLKLPKYNNSSSEIRGLKVIQGGIS
jgi:hypothetical protein